MGHELGNDAISASYKTDASVFTAFQQGFVEAIMQPAKGIRQMIGAPLARPAELTEHELARQIGGMAGNATLFYAATTLLKSVFPKGSVHAPIVTGAALGFLEPTQQSGDLRERLANGTSGALTMAIMEKMPDYLSKKGLHNDFLGNTLKVSYSGAVAGAVNTNAHSLIHDGKFADVKQTASAAMSWGVVGGLFHLGSLGMSRSFQALSAEKPELMLLAPKYGEAGYRVKDFLNSMGPYGVKYTEIDITKPGIRNLINGEHLPIVVFPDGSRVTGANVEKLASKLNLHTTPNYRHYRVAVVGGGPAGVQSAINAASELPGESEKVAVIADILGGQARYTSSVKNYMGFPDVTGAELMTRGIRGAQDRGAEIIVNRIKNIEHVEGHQRLTLANGTTIDADAVVLATGMRYNQLNVPGIERLTMKGVYTLADANEAPKLKDKQVFLVGAGNSAGQAAINFSRFAKEVHMVVRSNDLGNSMSQYLIDEIVSRNNIKVHLQSEVRGVDGVNNLETVTIGTKNAGGEESTRQLTADSMYVYIGGKPNTQFLQNSGVALNEKGFVLTGDQVKGAFSGARAPLPYETNIPGVFAAGDVNAANPQKRIVSAVGDAGKLIGSIHAYLTDVPAAPLSPVMSESVPANEFALTPFQIKLPTLAISMLKERPDLSTQLDGTRFH